MISDISLDDVKSFNTQKVGFSGISVLLTVQFPFGIYRCYT